MDKAFVVHCGGVYVTVSVAVSVIIAASGMLGSAVWYKKVAFCTKLLPRLYFVLAENVSCVKLCSFNGQL